MLPLTNFFRVVNIITPINQGFKNLKKRGKMGEGVVHSSPHFSTPLPFSQPLKAEMNRDNFSLQG